VGKVSKQGVATLQGTLMNPLLILGTRNPKKLQELQEILADLPLELANLTRFPDAPEVVEDGDTFEANARKKASETAKAIGQWVLAEDSGLVVSALNGEPGAYSARYAGKQGDDAANNTLLLQRLGGKAPEECTAHYACVAALANPQGEIVATSQGRCQGRIISEYRGTGGFGYDPLFFIPEYHQTFGELSARVKHALSHRARAMERMRPALLRELLR
jgi:XTP/dITP diphosphohydrolase